MLKKNYTIRGWRIRLKGFRIKGYNKIFFSSVHMENRQGYTIRIEHACVVVHLKRLFSTWKLKNGIACLRAGKIAITTNNAPVTQVKDSNNDRHTHAFNWEATVYPKLVRMINTLFNVPVEQVEVKEITADIQVAGRTVQWRMEDCRFSDNRLCGNGFIMLNGFTLNYPFTISINRNEQKIKIAGYGITISYRDRLVLQVTQSHLSCVIEQRAAECELGFELEAEKIQIDHPAFSVAPVCIQKTEAEVMISISRDRFEIGKDSAFTMNDVPVSFHLIHETREADLIKCTLAFIIEGDHFFASYPFFDRHALKEVKAEGEVMVQVDYMVSLADLSKYYFNAAVLKNTFRVTDFGPFFTANKHIADVFHDRPLHEEVAYSPLETIPGSLVQTVVTAEDPNFYTHSGIDPYFIGIATAVNLHQRRFRKGASTITMQLCKNLFFQQEKCITRKFNEMIVAWLLENHIKLSKEKILEIYLNIIEFAEGVYGIQEAAAYYFNKDVARLNVQECITLTYIIPRPKFFLEALMIRSTKLMANLHKHIQFHARKLYEEGIITDQEFRDVDYVINFDLTASGNKKITLQW
jgi:hypothetical protein